MTEDHRQRLFGSLCGEPAFRSSSKEQLDEINKKGELNFSPPVWDTRRRIILTDITQNSSGVLTESHVSVV